MTMQTKKNWEMAKLGEIVIPKGSVSGPFGSNIHSKFFTKDGVPVIRGNNLAIGFDPGRYVDNDYIYLSEKKADELSKSEALPEDIIVTARGTIGQTGIIPKKSRFKKYILSANQLRFRIDRKKANPLFVYYWLASKMMVRTMQNVSVNVGVPNLNLANTRNLQVPLPPLSIQDNIADILSAFDDKIELNNKISAVLEQMAQTKFNEQFVKNKTSQKGWEVKNVMEIIKRIPVGEKYENKTALPSGKVPILDQGQSGHIGFHNDKPGVIASIDEPVVVFTNHTCNYRLITYPFSAIQNVLPYVGINGYTTLFVYYLTRGKITMQEYKGHWPEFEQQEFLVPPPELAVEFSSYVKPMVQKMVEAENENQKLATLRDLLLPKLMSGEIRV